MAMTVSAPFATIYRAVSPSDHATRFSGNGYPLSDRLPDLGVMPRLFTDRRRPEKRPDRMPDRPRDLAISELAGLTAAQEGVLLGVRLCIFRARSRPRIGEQDAKISHGNQKLTGFAPLPNLS